MKRYLIHIALCALFLSSAFGQTERVSKHPGTNLITEDLVIGAGRTLTLNGTVAGTALGTILQAYDADLDDLADGTLTGSKVQAAGPGNQGAVTAGSQLFGGAKSFDANATFGGTNNTFPNQTYTVQGSGALTSAQIPKAQAYNTALQVVANSTWTKVNLGTEVYDTHNYLSGARFTPLVGGRYFVQAAIVMDAVGNTLNMAVYKNGVLNQQLFKANNVQAAVGGAMVEANGTTDYFEIFVWHNQGSDRNLYSDAAFRVSFALLP